jgi:hypothetical protein
MPAIAMGLLWAGYAGIIWGYSLLRGYNIGLGEIVNPLHPFTGSLSSAGAAGNTVVFPNGTKASTTNAPLGAGIEGVVGTLAGPQSAASVKNSGVIQSTAAQFGWGKGGQFNALTHLIAQESGGNPSAKNPSSGALGIAQALGHGNANTAGSLGNEYGGFGLTDQQARLANSGDAHWQLVWMMHYISSTYGDPAHAWAHEQANNWY